ncbi:MAG: hypothetical protein U9N31_05445 [Candidatus Marinimicrobia bacterium]|nr:hypothetical protein [Candidatus Neomarinimicrobiota bacterium]
MKLLKLIETIKTKVTKKLTYGTLVLLIVLDLIIPRHEVHFFGDKIPGFWSIFGFIACVLIIIVSKWIGGGLMQDENYYDK